MLDSSWRTQLLLTALNSMRGRILINSWWAFRCLFLFIHSNCIILIGINLIVSLLLLLICGLFFKKFILLVAILILQARINLDRGLCLTHLVTHIIEATHWVLCTSRCQMIISSHYFDTLAYVVIWSQRWHFSMLGIDQYKLVAHLLCPTLHYFMSLLAFLH